MYGECGQSLLGAKYNCKYDGQAKLLSHESENLFKEMSNEPVKDTSKRRSSFISPSILAKLNAQLMNITKFEFNNFLDSIRYYSTKI